MCLFSHHYYYIHIHTFLKRAIAMQKYRYCVHIFLFFSVFSTYLHSNAAAKPALSPKPALALATASRPSSPIDINITSPLAARRMLQRTARGNCIPRTCSHISLPKVEKSSPVSLAASLILPPINPAPTRLIRTNSAPRSFKPGRLTKDDSSPLSLSRSSSRSSEPTSSDSDDDS